MPKWLSSKTRSGRWFAGLTLFAFLLATVTAGRSASAQEDGPDDTALSQAKQHFEVGKQAFQARDYAGAVREFRAAKALRDSPVLDYNIALAYEQLGKPKAAARAYRRYLQGKPDAPNRADVEARVAMLDQQAAQQAVAPNQPPPSTDDVYSASEDMQPPQPQVRGADPYAGYVPPPPAGEPQYTTQPVHKKSYWWVVFPIVGGALLLTAIIVGSYYAYKSTVDLTTTPYYGGYSTALPSPSLNSASERDPGVLFRF